MRERDEIERPPIAAQRYDAPDNFLELRQHDELRDRQLADRDDELRPQEIEFVIHPGRAIADFVRCGNAIAAGRSFSWKTSADGGEINARTHVGLVHSAELGEPTEKRPSCCPGERAREHRFPNARRLTDKHYFAQDRVARNWWRQHARAAAALAQSRNMLLEPKALKRNASHSGQAITCEKAR